MGGLNHIALLVETLYARCAEVHDLDVAVAVDHHVLRLQVAMHDLQALEGAQRLGDVSYQAANVVDGWLRVVEYPLPQALAFDVFGDEIQEAALRARQDLHHAGMIDALADPLFTDEAVEINGVLGEGLRWHLECQTAPARIFNEVDVAACATGDHAHHPIAVDAGTGGKHRRDDLAGQPPMRFVDVLVGHLLDAHQQAA